MSRLHEVGGVHQPATVDELELEAGRFRQPFDDRPSLVVRIAEYLGDGQNSAWLERLEGLCQGRGTVGDFAQGRTEEDEIERPWWNVGLRSVSEDCRHVRDAHFGCFELETIDHARLDVNPHRLTTWQDTLRRWDEQATRSRPDLQDSLPWLKS